MSQLEAIIRPIASEIVNDFNGNQTLCSQVALTEFLSTEMNKQKLSNQAAITSDALKGIAEEIHHKQIEEESWTKTQLKNFLVGRIDKLLNGEN